MKHYTEADLLETWYMSPGASMPVMMHLASCEDCAGRYERLEMKLRSAASCESERPESFWTRQRHAVMHRVQATPSSSSPARRFAVAAVFATAIAGLAMVSSSDRQAPAPAVVRSAPVITAPEPASAETTSAPDNLWQTDEQLESFQSVVAWESWSETETPSTGDRS